jgi:hypothetical protein
MSSSIWTLINQLLTTAILRQGNLFPSLASSVPESAILAFQVHAARVSKITAGKLILTVVNRSREK